MDQVAEPQASRDARVERLWRKLDTQEQGYLDLPGLKRGLTKIDHPLKRATNLLNDVLRMVDTNGDGRIEFEEFRTFVERTEQELFSLFCAIDRDHNGKLDKDELQAAFKRAGVVVSTANLDKFFDEVDTNRDGVITFEEWRNFLLFLPADRPGLKAVFTYFSATYTLTAEGDTQLSEATEGLGIPSFLTLLFGSIISIASSSSSLQSPSSAMPDANTAGTAASGHTIFAASNLDLFNTHPAHSAEQDSGGVMSSPLATVQGGDASADVYAERGALQNPLKAVVDGLLTIAPDPGYFAAGGLAGVISRTSTAPLDRLKVYLIANTQDAIATEKGGIFARVRNFGAPLVAATRELWRVGGMRSLFAGNGLNVVKVMPESAIKFGSYEAAKRALAALEGHDDPQNIKPSSKFIAGGAGGMISQLCVYPIDTLKFRLQSETVENGLRGNALIAATAKKMWAQGGIRSCYRGLTMGLVGMFPYSAIDLGTFEFLKTAITRRNARILGCHEDDAAPGSFATGLIGAFSGATGASIVYPLNLLRTRLQMQGTAMHPATYNGIWDVAHRTVKNEGFRGLFKGITPNLLKVVPAVSITYVVYENAKKVMHLR